MAYTWEKSPVNYQNEIVELAKIILKYNVTIDQKSPKVGNLHI